ncbi:hypothetical protein [Clavibacter michiganensis]|nr:hypothetical protein [Clavibacter michiganensis]
MAGESQFYRGSPPTEHPRPRLLDVFDLSTLPAAYILELRLLRLTLFRLI